uniref:Uncharacterized protein n=1 Tax=Xiphophorus maculatus TaxID=8083 RepID=A0A3B5PS64_XIPMA
MAEPYFAFRRLGITIRLLYVLEGWSSISVCWVWWSCSRRQSGNPDSPFSHSTLATPRCPLMTPCCPLVTLRCPLVTPRCPLVTPCCPLVTPRCLLLPVVPRCLPVTLSWCGAEAS